MKLAQKRAAATIALLATSSVVLSACSDDSGSDGGSDVGTASAYELADVTGTITGAGATSQQVAMEGVFLPAFAELHSTAEYAPVGSHAGVDEFLAGNVDFAATDTPLAEDQRKTAHQRCGGNSARHLPLVAAPISVGYRLDGVDRELVLPAATIAEIFNGEVRSWDDPRIAEANPEVELPKLGIEVVYRADQSGTTEHFQRFLKTAAGDLWKTEGKVFPTPVGVGANGSAGVADMTARTNGAITYVESGALDGRDAVKSAAVDFGAGPVKLSADAVNAALAKAKFVGDKDDLVVDSAALYALKAPDAYPLVMGSYEVVCSSGYDEQTRDLVKNFLYTMLDSQDQKLGSIGYVPLAGQFKSALENAVESIG